MVTQITEGVKVSVDAVYQSEYSNPESGHYMFAYRIRIENMSSDHVQLLRRHWYIFDASDSTREVEGEGVVGLQPIIAPGESHEYVSGCNLKSGIGHMHGKYKMMRQRDGGIFDVDIPRFNLIALFLLN